jgi:elongation factor 1 alpha-like protein
MPTSRSASPTAKAAKRASLVQSKKSGTSTPTRVGVVVVDQRDLDTAGLNLDPWDEEGSRGAETPPVITFAREKLLEQARKSLQVQVESGQIGVSLVVIGKVTLTRGAIRGDLTAFL